MRRIRILQFFFESFITTFIYNHIFSNFSFQMHMFERFTLEPHPQSQHHLHMYIVREKQMSHTLKSRHLLRKNENDLINFTSSSLIEYNQNHTYTHAE